MERAAEDVAIEEALADVRHRGFLGRLSGGLVDEIIQSGTLVYHPAGSTSFPGRDGTQGSVVVAGLVRYFLSGLDGRQVTIRYAGVGDLVGTVISTVSVLPTRFQAIEPSVLLHLDVGRLEASAGQPAELALALIEELTSRLRHAYRALATNTFATVRSRGGDGSPGARGRH